MENIKTEILDDDEILLEFNLSSTVKRECPLNFDDDQIKLEDTKFQPYIEGSSSIRKGDAIINFTTTVNKCVFCDKLFNSVRLFKSHYKICDGSIKKHVDLSLHKCDICAKKYIWKSNLVSHKRLHTGERPYECSVCEKKFYRSVNLTQHKQTHSSKRPYQCDLCDKKYIRNQSLVLHMRTHTGERPYECDQCNRKFIDPTSLKYHKFRHSGQRTYKCHLCGSKFFRKPELNWHMRTHTSSHKYQCNQCNKTFLDKSQLIRHNRVHTGERPYQCEVCGKMFVEMTQLIQHKRIHTGERPYECDVCEKKFIFPNGLRCHKRIHTGVRPYECDVCGRLFTDRSCLIAHKRTHTGERPFQCDWCEKTFTRKSYLTLHQRRRHLSGENDLTKTASQANPITDPMQAHADDQSLPCDVHEDHLVPEDESGILKREHENEFVDYGVSEEKFPVIHNLEALKAIHTINPPFACSFCDKSFAQKEIWRLHVRMHAAIRRTQLLPVQETLW